MKAPALAEHAIKPQQPLAEHWNFCTLQGIKGLQAIALTARVI